MKPCLTPNWVGRHVIFDGYFSCDSPVCQIETAKKFLTNLAEAISMHVIDGPFVYEFQMNPEQYASLKNGGLSEEQILNSNPQTDADIKGISGLVTLAESHISFHTFPELLRQNKHFLSLDIYSCSWFEIGRVVDFLKQSNIQSGRGLIIERKCNLLDQSIESFSLTA